MEKRESFRPLAYDEMSKEQFDKRMSVGIAQAKNGRGKELNQVIAELIDEVLNVNF